MVYTGRDTSGEARQEGLGPYVVKMLCQPIFGTRYSVFFDNFFLTAELLKDRLVKGLFCCATTCPTQGGDLRN